MSDSGPAGKKLPAYAIVSVDHALQLAAVLQLEGRITVSEAAQRLGVAPSTAHRLLAMLVYRDFASQDADRTYRVGPVLELAAHSHSRTSMLRAAALPEMEALVEQFDETVSMNVRSGTYVRFIASVPGRQVLRVEDRTGMMLRADRSAGGLVLLAELDDAAALDLFRQDAVEDADEHPVNPRELLARLASVREQGFSFNRGLSERGVLAVGHAITDGDGRALAALVLSMPTVRFEPAMLLPIVQALRRTARRIERAIPKGE